MVLQEKGCRMFKKCAILLFFLSTTSSHDNYEQLGQTLNTISLHLIRPIHCSTENIVRCFMPIYEEELDGRQTISGEFAKRIVSGLHSTIALPLISSMWLLGGVLDTAGDCIQQKPYTKLPGSTTVANGSEGVYTFFSLNSCMFWGCLPLVFSGVSPARERIPFMSGMILKEDADFVLLQEVSYESAKAIWKRIKNRYRYGFTRIGPNFWLKMESGLFIASKYPILGEPHYLPFSSNSPMSRGLFFFETEPCWIFTTHLDDGGKGNETLRHEQMALIVAEIKKRSGTKPCLLFGDLNISRGQGEDREYQNEILQYFYDPCQTHPLGDETATWTKLLVEHAWGKSNPDDPDYERVDYVLLDKGSAGKVELKARLVPTFDLTSPNKCPTDHRGYKATLRTL